jgi:phage gp16-like protein
MSMPKPTKPPSARTRELALIHMGKAQLGMDEPTYRDMLNALTGKRSAREIGDAGRAKVLEHMLNSGAKLNWNKRWAQKLTDEKQPLVSKIRMLLLRLGNLSDSYADGISRRMYKVDRFEWLQPRQLIGIVTALTKQLDKVRAGAVKKDAA